MNVFICVVQKQSQITGLWGLDGKYFLQNKSVIFMPLICLAKDCTPFITP